VATPRALPPGRLGNRATFLGWLAGEALARTYASADMFLFAGVTDTFGQVILEAQASGLPVIAVDRGRAPHLDRGRAHGAATGRALGADVSGAGVPRPAAA
jgi:hypothetical protein